MSEELMQEFQRLKRKYDQVMKQGIRCNEAFINNARIHQEEEERRRLEQEKQREKGEQHAALRVGDGIKAIKGSLNGTIGIILVSRIDVGKGVTRFSVLSPTHMAQSSGDEDDVCINCGDGGNLTLCDMCDRPFHSFGCDYPHRASDDNICYCL